MVRNVGPPGSDRDFYQRGGWDSEGRNAQRFMIEPVQEDARAIPHEGNKYIVRSTYNHGNPPPSHLITDGGIGYRVRLAGPVPYRQLRHSHNRKWPVQDLLVPVPEDGRAIPLRYQCREYFPAVSAEIRQSGGLCTGYDDCKPTPHAPKKN